MLPFLHKKKRSIRIEKTKTFWYLQKCTIKIDKTPILYKIKTSNIMKSDKNILIVKKNQLPLY